MTQIYKDLKDPVGTIIATVKFLIDNKRDINNLDPCIVLVEGDDDINFYKDFFYEDRCIIQEGNGKIHTLEVLDILIYEYPHRVFAIVDDDFDSLEVDGGRDRNVVTTETHDIETMIIFSPALVDFVSEIIPNNFPTNDKSELCFSIAKKLENFLLLYGSNLGAMRWLSIKYGFNLSFGDLNYYHIIDAKFGLFSIELIFDELFGNNFHKKKFRKEFETLHRQLLLNEYDHRKLSHKDDVINVIMLIFPILVDELSPSTPTPTFVEVKNKISSVKKIEQLLYSVYKPDYFKQTRTYNHIIDWEIANYPLGILKI